MTRTSVPPELDRLLARLATGRVAMHVIAHPDDEHAGVLTWLNHRGACRAELWSWTRGEGGENRVGRERGRALGIRRAAEMTAAARHYGVAHLRFGGAPDDGYCRRIDNAWRTWKRDRLARALALEIRRRRPCIVLSRFFGAPSDGHAHHQASAVLTRDAVAIAADDGVYIEGLPAWQVVSTWLGEVPAGEREDVRVELDGELLERAERGYRYHETQDPDVLLGAVDHSRASYHRVEGPVLGGGDLFAGVAGSALHIIERGLGTRLDSARAAAVARLSRAAHLLREAGLEDRSALDELSAATTAIAAVPYSPALAGMARDAAHARARARGDRMSDLPSGDVPRSDRPVRALVQVSPIAPIGGRAPRIRVMAGPSPLTVSWPAQGRKRRRMPGRVGTEILLPLPDDIPAGRAVVQVWAAGEPIRAGTEQEVPTPLGSIRVTASPTVRVVDGARAPLHRKIGLIAGPRKEIAEALFALGVPFARVDPADEASLPDTLEALDTLLIGPRAYAVHPSLAKRASALRAFEARGGRTVVLRQTPEYDPARDAPFPGELPTDAAECCDLAEPPKILSVVHPLVCAPNPITTHTFIGWQPSVGAKFWSRWDPAYRPLIELCDVGQPAQRGVWLHARSGLGEYIYCALALEAQIAAGAPRVLAVLANLL